MHISRFKFYFENNGIGQQALKQWLTVSPDRTNTMNS